MLEDEATLPLELEDLPKELDLPPELEFDFWEELESFFSINSEDDDSSSCSRDAAEDESSPQEESKIAEKKANEVNRNIEESKFILFLFYSNRKLIYKIYSQQPITDNLIRSSTSVNILWVIK